jgi:hypothetical protein
MCLYLPPRHLGAGGTVGCMHKNSEIFGNSEIRSEIPTTSVPKIVPKFAISFSFTSELDAELPNALRKNIFKRVHGRFQLGPWLRDHVHL